MEIPLVWSVLDLVFLAGGESKNVKKEKNSQNTDLTWVRRGTTMSAIFYLFCFWNCQLLEPWWVGKRSWGNRLLAADENFTRELNSLLRSESLIVDRLLLKQTIEDLRFTIMRPGKLNKTKQNNKKNNNKLKRYSIAWSIMTVQGLRSEFGGGRAKANALAFGGMLPLKNLKLESSQMAGNASKTAEFVALCSPNRWSICPYFNCHHSVDLTQKIF